MSNNKGFTLVEVLVVVTIISILASILWIIIDMKSQINNAKAVKIANDFKSIERAFWLTAQEGLKEYGLYPSENEFGYGPDPSISTLVNNSGLKYIPANFQPPIGDGIYKYDNDNNAYPFLNNCSGQNNSGGVNLIIKNITTIDQDVVYKLDNIFDNGDGLKCGYIRVYNDNILKFNLDV
ncbi:MAG: prepilin-type N-terminal cleavage/methylation domain-containing protein, partial [Candidatus Pacebacteria bacterium]|nr:prepilin-type N-terminal cleavage/methylation domain-containing protein [Candidatus Paceibacterota bacterium]